MALEVVKAFQMVAAERTALGQWLEVSDRQIGCSQGESDPRREQRAGACRRRGRTTVGKPTRGLSGQALKPRHRLLR